MTFTPEQNAELDAPLSSNKVKKRKQAGFELSYIEGWQAISEANRIFGFDGWNRETVLLEQCGEPREVNDKARVAYLAKVRVTVGEVVREGIGYGSGIAKDLGDAFESAIKEAETDAMKRALMTFGNPFGLALYDKEQANVTAWHGPLNRTALGKEFHELQTEVEAVEDEASLNDIIKHAKPLIAQAMKDRPVLVEGDGGDVLGLKGTVERRRDYIKAREADNISFQA
jgi:DNA repair and recombination protein RAD52